MIVANKVRRKVVTLPTGIAPLIQLKSAQSTGEKAGSAERGCLDAKGVTVRVLKECESPRLDV